MESMANTQDAVRKTVWPWDAVAASAAPSRWRVPLGRLAAMGCATGALGWWGHARAAWIAGILAVALFAGTTAFPGWGRGLDRLLARLGHAAGAALTWLLLVPFFYFCFVPARLILWAAGKDPMRRAFPAPEKSCWQDRAETPGPERYRRQF